MNAITILANATPYCVILAGPLESVFGDHEAVFWKGALWSTGGLWAIYIIAVGLDDIMKHAANAFKYNLVALAVVFVGAFVYAKNHDSSGKPISDVHAKNPQKSFADQELDNFKSSEGRELQSKIEDLGIQDNALSESIEKLRSLLEKLDKDPESDEDYLAWKKKREDLRDEKAKLEERLKEAFLAYSKFKLTPTGEQEELWKSLLSDGEQDAEKLKNQYEDLKLQMEGGSSDEPKVEKNNNSTDTESAPEPDLKDSPGDK